jgi:predicted amidohydrolase YtcJ
VKGTIMPGQLADIVMLDRDIYGIDPSKLDQARVVLTIVDGKVVYER